MNDIYMKVIQQQMAAANQASQKRKKKRQRDQDKPKYEYDSDEDTEGGTWEHKKRAEEMQKTAGGGIVSTSLVKISKFLVLNLFERHVPSKHMTLERRCMDVEMTSKR